jgi:alcohol dehydrogenase, propanol-preferring
MKAARLHAYGQPLSLDDIPAPRPGPGEVVVRVAGAGFCHSDVHVIDGEIQILPRLPLTLGHENAGFVSALGVGVVGLREGDPVLVYGGWGCGGCDHCVVGEEQLCETPKWVGLSEYDGGYAEYLRVPRSRYLIPLVKIEPRAAAPLADAALTPYRAIKRALPYLVPDRPVLAIGMGGLGQYGLRLLQLLAGCPVIAVDTSERKLELASQLGAARVLRANRPDLAKEILELTRGTGVAAAFDFVGSDATLALALGTTRSGGKVTQIGLAGGTARLRPLENVRFEVLFETTLWGTLKELREVVALVQNGRLAPLPVDYAPLDQIGDVYQRVKRGQVDSRIVITP